MISSLKNFQFRCILSQITFFEAFCVASNPKHFFSLLLIAQELTFSPPTLRWYKFIDGSQRKSPVPLGERIKQVSGTLIIKNAMVDDSGKYLCVVNNSVSENSLFVRILNFKIRFELNLKFKNKNYQKILKFEL